MSKWIHEDDFKIISNEHKAEVELLRKNNAIYTDSFVEMKIDVFSLMAMLYGYVNNANFSEIEKLTNKTILHNKMKKYSANNIDELIEQIKRYMSVGDDNLIRNAPQLGPIQ